MGLQGDPYRVSRLPSHHLYRCLERRVRRAAEEAPCSVRPPLGLLDGLAHREQSEQADGGENRVGEEIAAKVREDAAEGGTEGVARGPGEVGGAEGEGALDARVFGGAGEHGGAGDEGGVEGPSGEDGAVGEEERGGGRGE